MFSKYLNSLLNTMGILTLTILFLSLVSPVNVDIWVLQYGACITIPVHLFTFLTFELKLFSRSIWVRRAIVLVFNSLVIITVSWIFGHFSLGLYNYIIVWVFGVTVSAALAILSYYVADKMEKKYLDAINKKLSENIDE